MIPTLDFKIEYRPHSANCKVAWLVDAAGAARTATEAEVAMWELLQRWHEERQRKAVRK